MNFTEMLSENILKSFKKNKISEACYTRVYNDAIAKERKLAKYNSCIKVEEDGRMTHTKYEFYCFTEKCENEIDKLFTDGWNEICKARKKTLRLHQINNLDEQNTSKSYEELKEILKKECVASWFDESKYGNTKTYIPFSPKNTSSGATGYGWCFETKDVYTQDEIKSIIEEGKSVAKRRCANLYDEWRKLKKFYKIK